MSNSLHVHGSESDKYSCTLPKPTSLRDLFVLGGKFPRPVKWLIIGLALFSAMDDLRNVSSLAQTFDSQYLMDIFSVVGYVLVILCIISENSRISFFCYVLYLALLFLANSSQSNMGSLTIIYFLLGLLNFSAPLRYAVASSLLSTTWCLWWSRAYAAELSQPVLMISLAYLTMATSIALVLRYISVNAAHKHMKITASEEASRLEALASLQRENELKQHTLSMRDELSRELHDVIGHQITSIAMRANLALLEEDGKNPLAQKEALENIAVTARQALTDMRNLVSMVKEPGNPGEGVGATDLYTFYTRIIARLKDLNFSVEQKFSGKEFLPLPLSTEKSVTAILRESATNIVKHAPAGSRCLISVAIDPQKVKIQTRNELGAGSIDFPVSGFGLNSLKQRVEAGHGRFYAGPAGSWWVLNAEIER